MNKKGATSIVMVLIALGIFAVAGGLIYLGVTQTAYTGSTGDAAVASVVATGDCNTDPYIQLNAFDAKQAGTAVGVNVSAIVNGEYIGLITLGSSGTTFSPGDKVLLQLNATNHLNQNLEEIELGCGENRITTKIYATDSMNISMINDEGTDALGMQGTVANGNQTLKAAGESYNLVVQITGKANQKSGDLIYIVELASRTNVSEVKLSKGGAELPEVDLPKGIADSAAGLYRIAFEIPSIEGAVKESYLLTLTPTATSTLPAAVYTTTYSKQAFTSDEGTFEYGIEDNDGDLQYEDANHFDFSIGDSAF